MAGYFIYNLDADVFNQLVTNPSREQGLALADYFLEDCEADDESETEMWPEDRDALANVIIKRLASPDWFSDLSADDAAIWHDIIRSLADDTGDAIGIDCQGSDSEFESVYWDICGIAESQGATMMAEPRFGNDAFRYSGKPEGLELMYTIYPPEKSQQLLAQLESVESHFASLPADDENRNEFFEGLLKPVRDAVANNRALWVETDY